MLGEALNNWHSGRFDLAQEQFRQLYATINQLPSESCRAMGHYFVEQHYIEEACVCYTRCLQFQYDEMCMSKYVQHMKDNHESIEQLLQFVYVYEELLSPQLLLRIIQRLQEVGRVDQTYALAVKALRDAEDQLNKTGQLTNEHIDLMQLVISHDVACGFLTQARFQLRKLLYVESTLTKYDGIVYWAIMLELVDCLRERPDYRTIKENCATVYRDLLQFYELFAKQQMDTTLAVRLSEYVTHDTWLMAKIQAVIQLSNLLQKKEPNKAIVQRLYAAYPMDFLIAKLYLVTFQPQDKPFWTSWLRYFSDLAEGVNRYRSTQQQRSRSSSAFEIAFLGGGEKIGGTAILVKTKDRAVLLDAGMFLNSDDMLTNFALLQQHDLTLQELDAVFVSHAHLDHIGSLPYIAKVAPNVPIYATDATKRLMQLLLKNVVRHQENCPYNELDIGRLFMQVETTGYGQTLDVNGWRVTFLEAGHIVGAASILLEMNGETLLFTGDISTEEQLTCGVFQAVKKPVDILITESTYGYTPLASRLDRRVQRELFIDMIEQTTSRGGTCLIPAFAVGRAQEVLSTLTQAYDGFFPFPVIIDGAVPVACDIYEVTSDFVLPNQVIVANCKKKGDIKRLIHEYPGAVIITSSGMLNEGSQSSYYAYELIDDPKSRIIFTGYLDAQSPAYDLFSHKNHCFKIEGEPWKEVQVKLASYALSAHIHRDDLLQLIGEITPKQVILMHGEHEKRYEPVRSFVPGARIYPSIVEMLQWMNIPTICAKNNEAYFI
ncbi:MAG: MBL fold metallo-hydrolase [Solibacillus sp.]